MEDLLREFLIETNESLETVDRQLVRLENEPTNAEVLASIFRLVHTIKGTCGFIGLPRLEALAHAAEALMGRFREGMPVTPDAVTLILGAIDQIKEILATLDAEQREPEGEDRELIGRLEDMAAVGKKAPASARPVRSVIEHLPKPAVPDPVVAQSPPRPVEASPVESGPPTLRVNVSTLERLMTITSELVLTRNQLLEVVRQGEQNDIKASLQRLSLVTSELQESVMKTRMQPIGNAWQKLPRIVRDLAGELKKEIDLQMLGGETELDRQILELIRDPLTHLIRNAADHGLERPAQRAASGKPPQGLIRLSARHEGGHILVELSDDGRGLNSERILAKAIAAGFVSANEAQRLTESQIHDFIFAAGFSTVSSATSISGRGVGLDVVRSNLDKIGGSVAVRSVPGAGVCFTLKIPLTLAIVSALIVGVGGQRYAIPELAVIELLRTRAGAKNAVEKIAAAPLIRLRGRLVPFVHLSALAAPPERPNELDGGYIVVMQAAGRRFGVVVDTVFQSEEIVVKPLSSLLRGAKAFSGNTILGDGSVVLIIDPSGLTETLALTNAAVAHGEQAASPPTVAGTALLLFRAGSRARKAIPLALISRLEEIPRSDIEISESRELVRFGGKLTRLVRLPGEALAQTSVKQRLLIFSEGNQALALAIDEVIDVINEPLAIEWPSETPGIAGAAVIDGQMTEIVDVGGLLPEDWLRQRAMARRTLRVLLVDDAAFFRSMLPPVLQAAGFRVTTVASASEALAAVEKEQYDAVVSDLEMPGIDGFALARTLRENAHTAEIPLIALSSHASPPLLERVRGAGFNTFVAKFDRPGLVAAIKTAAGEWEKAA